MTRSELLNAVASIEASEDHVCDQHAWDVIKEFVAANIHLLPATEESRSILTEVTE